MKRKYIPSDVQVTNLYLSTSLLAGSPGGGGSSAPSIHTGVPTDEQW